MAAAAKPQKLEDEVTCSICLEYFKNPVSIDCGHNFCQSCISQCWHGLDTNFACPQCRATSPEKNFRPNRQLGNIVEMLKLHLPALKPQEKVCERHQQRLQLFCQDDQVPICVVCDRSRDHRSHSVVPVEEAVQEYKKKLQNHLIQMKKDLEDVKRLAAEENKKEDDLKGEFQIQKEIIFGTFEELQQFLEKEKQDILGHLEKEHKEILEKICVKQADLEKQNSSFMDQITEMERKCLQEDVEFLMSVKSSLNRDCITSKNAATHLQKICEKKHGTGKALNTIYAVEQEESRSAIWRKIDQACITPENVAPCFRNMPERKRVPKWATGTIHAVEKQENRPFIWKKSYPLMEECQPSNKSTVNQQSLQNSQSLNACVQEKIKNLKEKFPAELERIYRKNFKVVPTLDQETIQPVAARLTPRTGFVFDLLFE